MRAVDADRVHGDPEPAQVGCPVRAVLLTTSPPVGARPSARPAAAAGVTSRAITALPAAHVRRLVSVLAGCGDSARQPAKTPLRKTYGLASGSVQPDFTNNPPSRWPTSCVCGPPSSPMRRSRAGVHRGRSGRVRQTVRHRRQRYGRRPARWVHRSDRPPTRQRRHHRIPCDPVA